MDNNHFLEKSRGGLNNSILPPFEKVASDFGGFVPFDREKYSRVKDLVDLRDFYWISLIKVVERLKGGNYSFTDLQCCFKHLFPDLKPILYTWVENSCFIDSLMFFMLNSIEPFWRDKISSKGRKIFEELDAQGVHSEILKLKSGAYKSCKPLRVQLRKAGMVESMFGFGDAQDLYLKLADFYGFSYAQRVDSGVENVDITTDIATPLDQVCVLSVSGKSQDFIDQELDHLELLGFNIIGCIVHHGYHYTVELEMFEGVYRYDDTAKNLEEIHEYDVYSSDIIFLSRL